MGESMLLVPGMGTGVIPLPVPPSSWRFVPSTCHEYSVGEPAPESMVRSRFFLTLSGGPSGSADGDRFWDEPDPAPVAWSRTPADLLGVMDPPAVVLSPGESGVATAAIASTTAATPSTTVIMRMAGCERFLGGATQPPTTPSAKAHAAASAAMNSFSVMHRV
jgi:hypothetical protein